MFSRFYLIFQATQRRQKRGTSAKWSYSLAPCYIPVLASRLQLVQAGVGERGGGATEGAKGTRIDTLNYGGDSTSSHASKSHNDLLGKGVQRERGVRTPSWT